VLVLRPPIFFGGIDIKLTVSVPPINNASNKRVGVIEVLGYIHVTLRIVVAGRYLRTKKERLSQFSLFEFVLTKFHLRWLVFFQV